MMRSDFKFAVCVFTVDGARFLANRGVRGSGRQVGPFR
jgi:hypothetical protein